MLIAVHTSGRTMTYQQPLNNIARCAIQSLAGAMVGCTAMDNATMDNAYAEPSALAARMSLNTQHIVAHETGVADVVDPLAGSYFVEALTNEVEQEATRILKKIDDMGGLIAAIDKGYIQEMLRDEANKKFLERGQEGTPDRRREPPRDSARGGLRNSDPEAASRRFRGDRRPHGAVEADPGPGPAQGQRIQQLHTDAQKGDRFNLMPSIVEAVEGLRHLRARSSAPWGAGARPAALSYDPFNMIESPFVLH
jgi:methylmalonyl-CoA mutase N-terminal domain/subunit